MQNPESISLTGKGIYDILKFNYIESRGIFSMKHIFVVNPAAGKGKKLPAVLGAITYACEELNVDFEIYHTVTVGDGIRYVREKCEKNSGEVLRFYACGGDGTLYEVINGAVSYPNTEVAIIPTGTGNDFIKAFSSPEFFSDIKRQLLGKPEALDLIRYNGRYCINVLNIGFDCDVVQKVSEIKRSALVPSGLAYLFSVANVFTRSFGTSFRVVIDDRETVEKEFTLMAVAGANYYGNGFLVAPTALLNDGYMDLCLVDKVTRTQFAKLISLYKTGRHVDENGISRYPFIRYQKCKKILVESYQALGVCADGEISPYKTVQIEIQPKAISFSVPKGARCLSLRRTETDEASSPFASSIYTTKET